MRKTLLVFGSLILFLPCLSFAQNPKPPLRTVRTTAAAHSDPVDFPAQLPVTRVSLYKNGVGFFEHAGRVSGDQAVTIDFTTAQLNDVLQSLTAVDLGGGRISGAGYNSTTPLDQQLKALPLALGEDATALDFYNAVRGAHVEVTGSGAPITGRVLNIEVLDSLAKESADSVPGPTRERRMLTVIGDDGAVRTVELTSATSVRLLDSQLHSDVTRYLQLLASTRNDGLRHLTLQDNGAGGRELHVSYLSEVPIWKSTYRILFTEPNSKTPAAAPQTATLQGWSVVDNTTGADWINVRLSLIAGAPQSFIQPISVPYYSRRPEVGLPEEAQLSPQTHESGEEDKKVVADSNMSAGAMQGQVNGLGAVHGQAMGGSLGRGTGSGFAGGVMARNPGSVSQTVAVTAAAPMLQTENAVINNELYANLAQASVAPNSTTAAFDDYFAYNLTEPITIRKNESALVPILQTKVSAERVTLWTEQQPVPLRALWVTNTSDLTLDRGSFTIVENGDFGGEGLLDPIHAGEKRLLSYAVDQAVRVSTEGNLFTQHATFLSTSKGVLRLQSTNMQQVTYVVHNAASDPRTVIVEHPVHPGYTLDSAAGENTQDPKPEETTPTVHRFRVNTAPGETVRLHVGERNEGQTAYQLTNFNDAELTYILNASGPSRDAIKQALQPILDARQHVADMQVALDAANSRMNELRSDEERQRANITALASADKASRDRFVHDLNTTEDAITAQQKTVTAAKANLQSAKDDLANKIASLQIDRQL